MRASYHRSLDLVQEQGNRFAVFIDRSYVNNIIALGDDAETVTAIKSILYDAVNQIDDVIHSRNVPEIMEGN